MKFYLTISLQFSQPLLKGLITTTYRFFCVFLQRSSWKIFSNHLRPYTLHQVICAHIPPLLNICLGFTLVYERLLDKFVVFLETVHPRAKCMLCTILIVQMFGLTSSPQQPTCSRAVLSDG